MPKTHSVVKSAPFGVNHHMSALLSCGSVAELRDVLNLFDICTIRSRAENGTCCGPRLAVTSYCLLPSNTYRGNNPLLCMRETTRRLQSATAQQGQCVLGISGAYVIDESNTADVQMLSIERILQ